MKTFKRLTKQKATLFMQAAKIGLVCSLEKEAVQRLNSTAKITKTSTIEGEGTMLKKARTY